MIEIISQKIKLNKWVSKYSLDEVCGYNEANQPCHIDEKLSNYIMKNGGDGFLIAHKNLS